MGGKLLSGINSIYANSLAYVTVKGSKTEDFRIDSDMRQGCIMFPWHFNVYMDAVMEEAKMGLGKRGVRIQEEGIERSRLASCMQMTWLCVVGRRKT